MEEKLIIKNSKKQDLVGILYNPENFPPGLGPVASSATSYSGKFWDSKGTDPSERSERASHPSMTGGGGSFLRNKKEISAVAIFCHGYRSDKGSSKVRPLAEKLNKGGIALFAFDFSGSGESDGKFENTTITQYISDLKCVMDRFSKITDKIALVGSSLGGLVVLNEALKDKRAKAIVLLSPVSLFPPKNPEYSEDRVREWKQRGYAYTHSPRKGDMKINYFFYEDGLKYSQNSIYKQIKIPILIIHGTADELVPFEDSRKLNQIIKNSTLLPLKGADHRYTQEKDFNNVMHKNGKTPTFRLEIRRFWHPKIRDGQTPHFSAGCPSNFMIKETADFIKKHIGLVV